MTARIQSVSGSRVTLELTIDLEDSMLASEEAILAGLNEAGCSLSEVALKAFDTDGGKIEKGGQLWHTNWPTENLPNAVWRYFSEAACLPALRRRKNLLPAGTGCADYSHLYPTILPPG